MSVRVAVAESDLVVELLASLGSATQRSNPARVDAIFTYEKFDVLGEDSLGFPVLGCTCFRIPDDEEDLVA